MSNVKALTRDLIMAKHKNDNLRMIKKLNFWGNDLTDVSILQEMPKLEVVSLAINRITTLRDFSNLGNLQELFIRGNLIEDLAEIRYLSRLPKLRNLWLCQNPCTDHPNYRSYVIKMLPNLEKLDQEDITNAEKKEAAKSSGQKQSFGREKERVDDDFRMKVDDDLRESNNIHHYKHSYDADPQQQLQKQQYQLPVEKSRDFRKPSNQHQRYEYEQEKPQQHSRHHSRSGNEGVHRSQRHSPQNTQAKESYGRAGAKHEPRYQANNYISGSSNRKNNHQGDHFDSNSSQSRPRSKQNKAVQYNSKPFEHENVMSAIVSLMKDLNVDELSFLRKEIDRNLDDCDQSYGYDNQFNGRQGEVRRGGEASKKYF